MVKEWDLKRGQKAMRAGDRFAHPFVGSWRQLARPLRFPGAGMLVVLVIFMGLVGLLEPSFLRGQNLSVLLQQASALIVASYGMAFVILSGNIDLSTGSIAAVSGVVAALIAKHTGDVPAGMLAGVAIGCVMGLINGILVAYVRIPSFIATFGTLTYGAGVALALSNGRPIYSLPEGFAWLGQGHVGPVPVAFLLAVLLLGLCQFTLIGTALGRRIKMVGGNRRAAHLSGVNTRFIELMVFVLAGALAGLAALILSSRVDSGQPGLAPLLQFKAIAAVAVGGVALSGGRGSMQQVFIGAFILGVLENALNVIGVSSYWQEVAIGVVVIAAIVIGQRNLLRSAVTLLRAGARAARTPSDTDAGSVS